MDETIAARIFQKLCLAYGKKFRGQFLDEAEEREYKYELERELADLSVDDVKRAFNTLPEYHPSFPPTLYEFRKLCLKRPTEVYKAEETEAVAPSPEQAKRLKQITKKKLGIPSRDWARNILKLSKKGEYKTQYGIDLAKAALREPE